ncbi:N-acetylglucosamine-6-phosphate deacetylase [Acerihabitans sp. KWT182]|uniref:N-acetylglucosamine-6-phosphate deacetylase n=1 Tax=Acerihabitans sp. KWT182 TaxID=3157919 RepID=A0AAU7Q7L8_9GAMM
MKINNPERLYVRRALLPTGWAENVLLVFNADGRIEAVEREANGASPPLPLTAMPALIDGHIHGAAGADVMDDSPQGLATIAGFLAEHGVGAFLATTVTAEHADIERALRQVKAGQQHGLAGAELLGSYLEGPFFTARHKGAHPERLLHEPQKTLLERWIALAQGSLHSVALAPEYDASMALIPWLKAHGIRVMIGHSNAGYDLACQALAQGADGVVHCYNGMNGLHHREPGMVGAALTTADCQVELIADGHHVHPAAMRIARRCCGERLLLISDAMRAAGMPAGDYMLGEEPVHMREGIVRTEEGSLAGSVLTLDRAVDVLARACDISLAQAWLHGSLYPARALGIADRLGSIEAGKQASLTLLGAQDAVAATLVKGAWAYRNEMLF